MSKWFSKNVTMFPILCHEYYCNTVCHKNFITICSLVYRLIYQKVIVDVSISTPVYSLPHTQDL